MGIEAQFSDWDIVVIKDMGNKEPSPVQCMPDAPEMQSTYSKFHRKLIEKGWADEQGQRVVEGLEDVPEIHHDTSGNKYYFVLKARVKPSDGYIC